MKTKLILLILGLCVNALAGDFGFAPIFNDGAVLQSEMPVNIWGHAKEGETVEVSFGVQRKTARADANGRWILQLDPMRPSPESGSLILSNGNRQVEVEDVHVGEVWLATGQSNMHVPTHATVEGREARKRVHPEIHFARMPQRAGAPYIQPCTSDDLDWGKFGPRHNQLAAVAFHFAEELQPKIGKHVGVIQCSYGGTPIEAWMPRELLSKTSIADRIERFFVRERKRGFGVAEWEKEMADFEAAKEARREWAKNKVGEQPPNPKQPLWGNPFNPKTPGALYESMTKDIIPYTARGVLWYQGEANAAQPDEYIELLTAHIGQTRQDFENETMPFYIVQLSGWGPGEKRWPAFRAAQAKVRDSVPNTGLALSLDKGDKVDIHPRDKKPVGQRLAYLALKDVYGMDTPSRGPKLRNFKLNGDRIVLTFDYVEEGLKTLDGEAAVTGFEIAGSDNQFVVAEARITGTNEITVLARSVAKPTAVRYAWHGFCEPELNLYNSADLPTEPFLSGE